MQISIFQITSSLQLRSPILPFHVASDKTVTMWLVFQLIVIRRATDLAIVGLD
jgi:hypothetical protein